MSDVTQVGQRTLGRLQALAPASDRPGDPGSTAARPDTPLRRGEDRLEISDFAVDRSRTTETAPLRRDLVDRVRSEIAAGTYETPEKIDLTIDALANNLDLEA